MPIEHIRARMRPSRLGKIRLGVKKITIKDGKQVEYPAEVSYFVLPPELVERFPKQPTSLEVMLPSDDPDIILEANFLRYQGKLLTLRCDGKRFLELPRDGGEIVGACRRPLPEPGQTIIADCPCEAVPIGKLRVMLLKGPVGYYEIPIGGFQRIADLQVELQTALQVFGRLRGIVFRLTREPAETMVRKDTGQRLPRTGYPVHLRSDFTTEQAMLARGVDPRALPGGGAITTALTPAVLDARDVQGEDSDSETDEEALAHEAAQEEEADQESAPVPEAPPEDDISIAIGRAAALGITEKAYRTFLEATYGEPWEQLAVRSDVVAEQMAMFNGAQSDAAKIALKSTILAKVNQTMRRARST
jgi:hypothetical protein